MRHLCLASLAVLLLLSDPASAGPPYVTDDPAPTDTGHFEIFAFGAGTHATGGTGGAAGLDFNYGALPDLQLSMTVPVAYEQPTGRPPIGGIGNIELAAKYRILHQDDFGLDVAVFPRVFLPSASDRIGEQHATYFLPVWIGRESGPWSAFGGGGCALNRGGGAQDFCLLGAAVTREVLPDLRLGAEVYHVTPDVHGGQASTGLGFGAVYDLTMNLHLIGSAGPGIQNAAQTNRYSWYAALMLTF